MKKTVKHNRALKRSTKYFFIRKACPIFLTAIASLFPWHGQEARADLVITDPTNWALNSTGGDYKSIIGSGPDTPGGYPGYTLTINADATAFPSGNNPAISVSDDWTINVLGTVKNQANGNGGFWNAGPNTIEARSNNTIHISSGAEVLATGTQSNGEAINLIGNYNSIVNNGLVQSAHGAAIWFQDTVTSPSNSNTVDNYGTIQTLVNGGNSNAIGNSGQNGVVFINRAGGTVYGNLSFAGGDDQLVFEPGSIVTGTINGGGGTNTLTLQGTAGSSDSIAGALQNFTTLKKEGEGTWTITGTLTGFKEVDVNEGKLVLTGDNSGYNGKLLINASGFFPTATLEAKARSLPTTSTNIGNIVNNGTLRFIDSVGDDGDNGIGTYTGQITGSGIVEMTGTGVVTLAPTTGVNTYSGGTYVKNGTLAINTMEALGTGGLYLGSGTPPSSTAGTLRLSPTDPSTVINITKDINLQDGGGIVDTNGNDGIVSGIIQGGGSFTKAGDGTLQITNNSNFYAGGTYITGGTLEVGDGTTNGSIPYTGILDIVGTDAALAINRSDTVEIKTEIVGAGKLIQRGSGTLILDRASTYTGGTEIENGTIEIADAKSLGETDGGATAGHVSYTGADVEKTIEVKSGMTDPINNHFHTETGTQNIFRATGNVEISSVDLNRSADDKGGAFYIGSGTKLTLFSIGILTLDNNKANGVANDIYIADAGTMDIDAFSGGTVYVKSGLDGLGTLNTIGSGTVQIEADSPFGGMTNVNAGTFRVIKDVTYGSASATFNVNDNGTAAGGGIVVANTISVTGHLTPDNITNGSQYGTLTFQAGSSITMDGFSMDFDISTPSTPDWGTPPADQDLLVIEGPQVQNFNGTIDFRKNAGFENGTYLVIRSDNGFAGQDGTPLTQAELDGINNPDGVLKATLDGYDIHSTSATPRQTVEYSYGNNGADTKTIWLNNSLNSLTMDWTAGSADWDSGERMLSLQTWTIGGEKEKHFLSGDKVHISNDGAEITVTLESADGTAMNPVVSGLVIGKNSGTDGTDGTVSGGDVIIDGRGGITSDKTSAFGVYAQNGTGTPLLGETGKLEKYGSGTLTFQNIGGNLFKSGIDLYGGTLAFNIANQLNVGTGTAITFADDATLQPNASASLTTPIAISTGATGTFHVDQYADGNAIGLFLNGNVNGPGNLKKTGAGVLQFADNVATTNAIADTTVEAGKFRIVQDKTYNSTGLFALNQGAELSGGGTVIAGNFDISGKIATDKAVMTPTNMDVIGTDRIGTLTLQGTGASTVTFNSTVMGAERQGFNFDYRATAPNDTTTPLPTPNDLLKIENMTAVKLQGGVINFMTDLGSLTTGSYLIIDSNVGITDGSGNAFVPVGTGDGTSTFEIDGINENAGVMWGKINGNDIRSDGPRGDFHFELRTGAIANSQLWLDVNHNTLQTVWQDGNGNWSTGDWESIQHTNPSGLEELYDYNFFDGDLVYFKDMATPANYTVTVDRDVIVSGVDVDTTQNITFDGDGGITAKTVDPALIVGQYAITNGAPPIPANQEFNTTGKLVKWGTGTLTLANTGKNTFEEGVDIYAGTIALKEADRLGKYGEDIVHPNAGQVTFKNNNGGAADASAKAIVVDTAQILQNRFVVEQNVTGANITANVDTEISGIKGDAQSGAIRLEDNMNPATSGLKIHASGGDITMSGNTTSAATGNDIYIGDQATVSFYSGNDHGDEHHIFIDSGIAGSGSVQKFNAGILQIAADSDFLGQTSLYQGTFHVVGDRTDPASVITYGNTTSHVFNAGVLSTEAATIAGGGIVAGKTFTIGNSSNTGEKAYISPDSATLTNGNTTISDTEKYGTLTLQGNGTDSTLTFKSVPLSNANDRSGFHFDYDVSIPNSKAIDRADVSLTEKDPDNTDNDLLQLTGMTSVNLEGGVINFRTGADGLQSGRYLIIDSNTTITDINGQRFADDPNNGNVLDGINLYGTNRGVLWGKLNGEDMRPDNPRAERMFYFDAIDPATNPDSQIWLEVNRNTLKVDWQGGNGVWMDGGVWKSEQYSEINNEKFYDNTFNNGDYVVFGGGTYNVTLQGNVVVSGMDANVLAVNNVVTIEGTGGIRAIRDNTGTETYIEGQYAVVNGIPDPDEQQFSTSGKLVKTGAGELVFRNVGGNNFEEGIDLYGGTTAFDRADQLGNTTTLIGSQVVGFGNKITFVDSATLRADDSVTTYNETIVASGKTATFETADDVEWKFSGNLLGGTDTKLSKAGLGTLSLYNHLENNGSGQYVPTPSAFVGAVDVSEGKLAVYGDYRSTGSFEVEDGATLSGTGFIGSMNGGTIRSGGHLAPGGLTTFADAETTPVEHPLTIVGNLTFDAGSNFDVRITQFDNGGEKLTPYSDRVNVEGGGTVSIDAAANLNVDIDFWGNTLDIFDFNEQQSDHFTIIDATEGAVDDYAAQFDLNLNEILPRGVVMKQGWYDGGDLFQLWFEGDGNGFGNLCDQWNRIQIGTTLDQLVWSRDPAMKDLIQLLSDPDFSDRDVCLLLDQITGDLTPNAMMMALKKPWRHPFNRLELAQPSCDPCASANASRFKRQLWGEFYGRYDDVRYDGNAHSFTINRYGVVVGVDQQLSRRSIVGMAFNYSDPRLRQDTGKVEMDDYEIGFYNMTKLNNHFEMKLYAGYSHQRYDFDRWVHIPGTSRQAGLDERFKSKTDGDAFSASVELIRPIRYRSNLLLLPTIAFDFEQAWMKGYRESGGLTALNYDKSTLERMMLRFGLDTEYAAGKNLDLKARIQYATQINSNEYPRVGVRFVNSTLTDQRTANIWGSRIGRDYLNLGIGMDWQLNAKRTTMLYINYDADLYNRATVHAGEFGLIRRW